MDTPTRRSTNSHSRKERRSNNSPYSRTTPKRQPAQLAVPHSSSLRSLFNFVSSPFRSAPKPAPAPIEDDCDSSDDGEDYRQDEITMDHAQDDDDMEANTALVESKGKGGKQQQMHRSATSSFLHDPSISSRGADLPHPSSAAWLPTQIPAARASTRAYAATAETPSAPSPSFGFSSSITGGDAHKGSLFAAPEQPKSLVSSGGDHSLGRMSRSQTLPTLVASPAASSKTRAQIIMERLAAEAREEGKLTEEEEEECRSFVASGVSPSKAQQPVLFSHGTSSTRPTSSVDSLTRSSSLSFLSPSRAQVQRASLSSSSSSTIPFPSISNGTPLRKSTLSSSLSTPSSSLAVPGRPESGTPRSHAKRRPIYLGPGASSPRTGLTRSRTLGGWGSSLDLKKAAEAPTVVDSPKKRRVESTAGEGAGEENDVEMALSGLEESSSRSTSSSKWGQSFGGSLVVPPSQPFSFSSPGQQPPAAPSSLAARSSTTAPTAASSKQPTAAQSSIKPSVSLSSGLSRYARNPSLVAPSPLRQSTSFASPDTSPAGKAAARGASFDESSPSAKKATKTAGFLLGLIEEEEVKKAGPPTPIQNPYQAAAGVASPTPRRNPRRSAAAASRSRAASATPSRKQPSEPAVDESPSSLGKGRGSRAPTTLELLEREERDELARSTSSPATKQRAALNGNAAHGSPNPFLINKKTPAPVSAQAAESTTPTAAHPSSSSFSPSWASAAPPKVLFAHDAEGGVLFGKPQAAPVKDKEDAEMSASPEKVQAVFGSLQSPMFQKSTDSKLDAAQKDKPPSSVFSSTPKKDAPASTARGFSFGSASASSTPSKKPAFSFPLPSTASTSSSTIPPPLSSASPSYDPKAAALATPKGLLPVFAFTFSACVAHLPTTSDASKAMRHVAALPKADLPRFEKDELLSDPNKSCNAFQAPPSSLPSAPLAPPAKPKPANAVPVQAFNWGAAGVMAPKAASGGWSCPTCMLNNKEGAEKCVSCEELAPKKAAASPPASVPSPSAPAKFNWDAAGLAPKATSGGWECPTCMVSNQDGAVKCVSCEEPAPQKKAPTAPSTSASATFNWGAAGLAPKQATSGWECPTCMVSNKADVTQCVSCEEPVPHGKTVASLAPAAAPTNAPVQAFNWGAAGLAPKQQAPGGWTCGVCMVPNPAGAVKCVSCESARGA